MKHINLIKLTTSILLPFLAGGIGSFATASAISMWYATLNKPPFNPPNCIFGPVWSVLYLLMGISLYLILIQKDKSIEQRIGVMLFATQLLLNTLWSLIFFGLRNPALAFGEIIILWIFIFLTIIYFNKVNKIASFLLIPYLAWVSFAAILNLWIMILN